MDSAIYVFGMLTLASLVLTVYGENVTFISCSNSLSVRKDLDPNWLYLFFLNVRAIRLFWRIPLLISSTGQSSELPVLC